MAIFALFDRDKSFPIFDEKVLPFLHNPTLFEWLDCSIKKYGYIVVILTLLGYSYLLSRKIHNFMYVWLQAMVPNLIHRVILSFNSN